MEPRDQERPATMSRQQRRILVAYGAVVGVIAAIIKESFFMYCETGSWRPDPPRTAFGCIGMALAFGGAFWILTRSAEARPEQPA